MWMEDAESCPKDNTSTHKSHAAMQTIPDLRFELFDHPLCSPDLVPSVFPQLIKGLKNGKCSLSKVVIEAVDQA